MAGFLNCVVVASIVFEPIGLPLSIAVQHALTGFVITQLVVTKLTGVGALLTVPSFEALPFMARYAVLVSNALGPDQMPSILATVLAGCLEDAERLQATNADIHANCALDRGAVASQGPRLSEHPKVETLPKHHTRSSKTLCTLLKQLQSSVQRNGSVEQRRGRCASCGG